MHGTPLLIWLDVFWPFCVSHLSSVVVCCLYHTYDFSRRSVAVSFFLLMFYQFRSNCVALLTHSIAGIQMKTVAFIKVTLLLQLTAETEV